MKLKPTYQWILRDHQETSFPRFEITETYHATKEELESYYPNLHECRSIVGKYNPSKIFEERLIITIKQNQMRKKAVEEQYKKNIFTHVKLDESVETI